MIRRFAAGLAVLCILIGLIVALAVRISPANPVLGSVLIGSLQGYPFISVDSRTNRAFILDDGVTQQQVTVMGNGYSWSSPNNLDNKVRVIDTGTGRLVTTASVPTTVQSLAVDEATGRVFAFDQGQIQLIDAHNGKLLNTAALNGDAADASERVDTALADSRSGRLFVTMDLDDPSMPERQHLLMLDGRTGKTLRDLTFPHGQGIVQRQPHGVTTTYYPASLWPALDERAGRLYVFNTDREMSVVDTASGRILDTRRLPIALINPMIDEQTGRIFAFTVPPQQSTVAPANGTRPPASTLIMFDPRSGVIRQLVSIAMMWPPIPPNAANNVAVDETANHVIVVDNRTRSVTLFDAASGRRVHTTLMHGIPYQLAVDARRHRALVGLIVGYSRSATIDADTRIAVLDTRTGALLRAIPIKQAGYSLAVDTGNGHAITVHDEIGDGPADSWGWMPAWLRKRVPWLPPPPSRPALGPNQRIMTNTALTIDPSQ